MKVFTLFSLCYALFFIHAWEENKTFVHFYHQPEQSEILRRLAQKSQPYFQNQTNWSLANALITGNNKGLTKTDRKAYKELNLNHLFSPSGLHFSSILIPLKPLYKMIPGFQWIVVILLTPLFFLPGLYSLKRSLLFLNLSTLNKDLLKISCGFIFISVFVIDFIFGSFDNSILSFIFSLLFWGIFILEKKLIRRLVYLTLAQFMCACFMPTVFYPLALPLNMLISLFFTLVFPITLGNFLCPTHSFIFEFGEKLLGALHQMVIFLHELLIKTPTLSSSHLLLWILLFFIFFPKQRLTLFCVAALIISMTTDNKDDLRQKMELKLLKTSVWKRE